MSEPDNDQRIIRDYSRRYNELMGEIETRVAEAMLHMYTRVTGKQPSDKLTEAVEEAIRYNG